MNDRDYVRQLIAPPDVPARPGCATEAADVLAAEIERRIQHGKPALSAPAAWQYLRDYYYSGHKRTAPRLPWSLVLEAQRLAWARFDHLGPHRAPPPVTMIKAAAALRAQAQLIQGREGRLMAAREAQGFLRAAFFGLSWEAARLVQREFWGSVEWRILRQRARTPAQRAAHARRLVRAIDEAKKNPGAGPG